MKELNIKFIVAIVSFFLGIFFTCLFILKIEPYFFATQEFKKFAFSYEKNPDKIYSLSVSIFGGNKQPAIYIVFENDFSKIIVFDKDGAKKIQKIKEINLSDENVSFLKNTLEKISELDKFSVPMLVCGDTEVVFYINNKRFSFPLSEIMSYDREFSDTKQQMPSDYILLKELYEFIIKMIE